MSIWTDCVEAGWKPIVERLEALCEHDGVAIFQVKEKFGELRFYCAAGPDDLYAEIDKAEEQSRHTCEFCGKPGHIQPKPPRGYWLKCLCPECYDKFNNGEM